MERRYYPAQIEGVNDSYSVWFVDFPGCVSAGGTIAETIEGAHEALALHVSGMIEDGEQIPVPSAPALEDGSVAVAMVRATLPGKAVRLNITMDEGLVAAIDRIANNRSSFLAEAARAALVSRSDRREASA